MRPLWITPLALAFTLGSLGCARTPPEQTDNEQTYRGALDRKLGALRASIASDGATPQRAAEYARLARGAHRSDVRAGRTPDRTPTDQALTFLTRAAEQHPSSAGELSVIKAELYELREQPALAAESYNAAIAAEPKPETFRRLLELPRSDAGDAAVLAACAPMREVVSETETRDLLLVCLDAAHGERSGLQWTAVELDVAELDELLGPRSPEERETMTRRARARVFGGARLAGGTVAAVFASGRCHADNCGRGGWTGKTPRGEVQVRCAASGCLKDGWEARLPGGHIARTQCEEGLCLKGGWKTTFPDGQIAVTTCRERACATNGWVTTMPDGVEYISTCAGADCATQGWTTALGDGVELVCTCVREQCGGHGVQCE